CPTVRSSALFSPSCSLRPPPPSPLFPSTTLFRSCPQRVQLDFRLHLQARHGGAARLLRERARPGGRLGPQRVQQQSGHRHTDRQDRKSTRLNSSHVSISYAVFCLKKKKKL